MKWSPHTHTQIIIHMQDQKKHTQTQQQCGWVDVCTCTYTWICVNTPSFARVYNLLCCSPNETPQWVRLALMRVIEAPLQKLGGHWGTECWEISWNPSCLWVQMCWCISDGPLIQLKGDPHLCGSSSHDYFTTKACSSLVLRTRIYNSNYLHERRILNILTLILQIELS